jgi:hypothetical protein
MEVDKKGVKSKSPPVDGLLKNKQKKQFQFVLNKLKTNDDKSISKPIAR